ncbi:MAG: filamentous hemagglutinin N-terminal domain-containing protein [Phormidesmis sp.]
MHLPGLRPGLGKLRSLLTLILLGGGVVLGSPGLAKGQIVPDETLGVARSQLTSETIRDLPSQRIDGGAARGENLFHSFQDFNIGIGQGAYFSNPAEINRIFSRVTGSNPSNILGRLGVLGSADLFFMNPNGILFGPSSSLDIQGSFAGTTADAIEFGENSRFSATSPDVPLQILTVNPSAFLFSQLNPAGIINNSITLAGASPSGILLSGLRVVDGQSLLLLGGDITMNSGRLNAPGGRIELGGLAEPGVVTLNPNEPFLTLTFPEDSALADLSLANEAVVGIAGIGGGAIVVHADKFTATSGGRLVTLAEGTSNSGDIEVNANALNLEGIGNSSNRSGLISFSLANATGTAGNIIVNAESVTVQNGAAIASANFGGGDTGNVVVDADTIEIAGSDATGQLYSGIFGQTQVGSSGNGGDVSVFARILSIRDGATISASTFGSGTGGNLRVEATERAELIGTAINAQGQIAASGLSAGTTGGDAGSLRFDGGQLLIRDGAGISASTSGEKDAGAVIVNADTIEIIGLDATGQGASSINSEATVGSSGNGGNVTVSTRLLEVRDGATLSTSTRGSGAGGNLIVNVTERAELIGTAINAQGQVAASGLSAGTTGGNAGSLRFDGGQLLIRDGAGISAATSGEKAAGAVIVNADTIEIIGRDATQQFASGIGSEASVGSSGNSGDVTVSTRLLEVRDGATISVNTVGSGTGGNLRVEATERAELIGTAINAQGQVVASRLSAGTAGGDAGSLRFDGGQLLIRDGAGISATTNGAGAAGAVLVNADTIELVGLDDTTQQFATSIESESAVGSSGDGGDVTVSARLLQVKDGAIISATTRGSGAGGNLIVNVTERAELIGSAINAQGQVIGASGLSAGTMGSGDAGSLRFNGRQLLIRDGAGISASTSGEKDAGAVIVNADMIELVGLDISRQFASGIGSEASIGSSGNGGDVTVSSRILQVRDGATVSTSTRGSGAGGNLVVNVTERAELIGTAINAQGQVAAGGLSAGTTGGNAGSLRFDGEQLLIRDGAGISASTSSGGAAGAVVVNADTIELIGLDATGRGASSINSEATVGSSGNGGDVTVSTRILQVKDGATVSATTRGSGTGGNLIVNVTERAELIGSAINAQGVIGASGLFAGTTGSGTAGSLRFDGEQLLIRDGAGISAATSGEKDAGAVVVNADTIELVGLDATGQGASGIGSEASVGSSGNGGDVTISTRLLQVRDGATVSTSTRGSGMGGNLRVGATERAELIGTAINAQGQVTVSGLSAGTAGSGNAGSLRFDGEQLLIRDGAGISASTSSGGAAGAVVVNADTIELIGLDTTRQFASGIGSEASVGSSGNGGGVTVSSRILQVRDGATVSTSTRGSGAGGDLIVNVTERAELIGSAITAQGQVGASLLSAGTTGSGTAGSLRFDGEQLLIRDGAGISAATNSGGAAGAVVVNADTIELVGLDATGQGASGIGSEASVGSSGDGGDVTVSARLLQVRDGAVISGGTFGEGDAGSVRVVADFIDLTGLDASQRSTGGIGSEVGAFATGNGGDVMVSGRALRVREGAVISARSFGSGDAGDVEVQFTEDVELSDRAQIATASLQENARAGDITITAGNTFSATDGNVVTSAANASGGNITITANGVRLFGNSDIRTDSAQDGGNVTITANSVVALDDSDIFASAAQGRGGAINLETTAFFGQGYRLEASENDPIETLEGNGRVDLNATGQVSSGIISTPDTSFIQNDLAELSGSLGNTDQIVASSCIARTDQGGTFIATHADGLPTGQQSTNETYATGAVRSIPTASEISAERRSQPEDFIVEPQGVYELADGRLVMGRACVD